jgi:hypothetical protein
VKQYAQGFKKYMDHWAGELRRFAITNESPFRGIEDMVKSREIWIFFFRIWRFATLKSRYLQKMKGELKSELFDLC